jgi:hypothetical protein
VALRRRSWGSPGQDPPNYATRALRQWTDPPGVFFSRVSDPAPPFTDPATSNVRPDT